MPANTRHSNQPAPLDPAPRRRATSRPGPNPGARRVVAGLALALAAAALTAVLAQPAAAQNPATLTLSTNAASNTVTEGGSVTVTATLDQPATQSVSVTLSAKGTSTAASTDYTLPPAFTIAAGQSTGTGSVQTTDDDVDEDNETVVLTTSVGSLTVTDVTLTITDDDTAGVSLSQTARSVEVGATTTYTVVLDSQPTASVTVTPTSGSSDKATVAPASVTFTTANWKTPKIFTVTGVAVGTSAITHAATSTDTDYSIMTVGTVTATVSASTKTFRVESTKTVAEGSTASLAVTLGQAAPNGGLALSVAYGYSGSSAGSAADLGPSPPSSVTVLAGATTATLRVPTRGDSLVEGDETFTATLSTSVSGWAGVSGEVAATVTITDDDAAAARIGFGTAGRTTEHTISVAENVSGGMLNVPVQVSHNPQASTTVAVEVRTGGTATEWQSAANPGDFRIVTKSVTFTPTGSRTQNLTVSVTDDMVVEDDQTILLRIADSTGSNNLGTHYTRHSSGRLSTVTVTDDEAGAARIAFGTDAASTVTHQIEVEEDVSGGSFDLPVTINRAPESSTTVEVYVQLAATGFGRATEWQSAANPGDFRVVTKSVTFTPTGALTQNIAVTVTDDDLVEESQRFFVRFSTSPSSGANSLGRHYTSTSATEVAILVIDDDDADDAKIAFGSNAAATAATALSVTEDVSGGMRTVAVTVSHLPDVSTEFTVSVVPAGTTATSADYSVSTATVTFGPTGAKTKNAVLTVTDNDLVEDDETVQLSIANSPTAGANRLGRHYTRHASGRMATVTIEDDDQRAANVAFHASDASSTAAYAVSVDEDDGTIDVPVTVSHLPESSTTFTVEVLETATRPATQYTNAANPGDYRVLGNKAVTFSSSGAKTRNVRVQLNNNALVEHPETVQLRIVAADSPVDDLGDYYDRHASSRLATLTVNDDDAAAAKIAIGPSASSTAKFTVARRENVSGSSYSLPITVSHLPSQDTTFTVEVLSTGTAVENTDYSIGTKTVTFGATGSKSRNVIITFTDDDWAEDDQTIEVRIVAADATVDDLGDHYARDSAGALGRVTIEDDEQRTAKIAFGDAATRTSAFADDVDEDVGGGTVTVPVTINHLPESDTTFTVEVLSTGTAVENTDYSIGTKTVMFGATGDRSKNVTITVTDDNLVEGDQTIGLRIVAADTTVDDLGDYYDRHPQGSLATLTIDDDEAAAAKVAFGDSAGRAVIHRATADEPATSGTTATFNVPVTLSYPPESSTTFEVRVLSGLATQNTDYSISTKAVTFTAAGGLTQNLVVTLNADDEVEGNETINLQLAAADAVVDDLGDHYARHAEGSRAAVLVTDPDATASLELRLELFDGDTAASAKTVAEGGAAVRVAAFLTGSVPAGENGVTVRLLAAEGTTAALGDYTLPATLTIPPGTSLGYASVVVADDPISEDSETLVLSAATSPAHSVSTATLTITDNDQAAVSVPSALSVGEGGTATYQVRLATRPDADVVVTPASADETKATVSGPLTFTARNWSRPQRVTVTGAALGEGTVAVVHTAASADPMYDGLSVDSVTVTVTPEGKTFSIASATADEGTTATLAVTLGESAPAGGLTFNVAYDYSISSAVAADTGTTPTTLVVAANSRTATLEVPIADDDLVDGPESFRVTISATGWQATSAGADRATVAITDDDAADAKIAFGDDAASTATQSDYFVHEGAGTSTVSVTISHLPQATTVFAVQTLTGTASASQGADYTVSSTTVTFGPTDATKTKDITFTITDDSAAEGNEVIRLRIAAADNPADDLGDHYQRHALGSLATLTIIDDDAATAVDLSTNAPNGTVAEDAGSVSVTATLNGPAPPGGVTVTLRGAGTAASPDDYTIAGTIRVPPGGTTASGTIRIVDDQISETSETIILSGIARSPTGAFPVTGLTLTITDNDTAGVTVSETALAMPTGQTLTYTVRLQSRPAAEVTITPTTSAAAQATVSPASLVFTAGDYSVPQTVTVTGVAAGSATISHAASGSSTVYNSLSIDAVTVTVSTPAKTFAIASAAADEGDVAELAVTLGEPAPSGGLTLGVAYDYSGSTATADDTGTTQTTLNVPEGVWRTTLAVPIAADSLVEGVEDFTVTISASGWSAASTGAGVSTVTINDIDAQSASIAFGNLATSSVLYTTSVAEDTPGGVLEVPVTISHLPSEAITFEIAVVPGRTNAVSSDYSIASATVSFEPAGSRTKSLEITITDDASVEPSETIRLRIVAADDPPDDLGDRYARHPQGSQATVTITDSGGGPRRPTIITGGPIGPVGPPGPTGGPGDPGGPGGPNGDTDDDGDDGGDATRVAGADRYATSLRIAEQVAEANDGKLATIVLAGGHSWTDALAAAPLAGALDAALVLTAPGRLPADTITWLKEIGVTDIIAVGDDTHITDAALEALNHIDDDIERITAADPYTTSAKVAARIGQPDTLGPLLGRTVIIASGNKFPDALAAGPLAAAGPHPVLYADTGALAPEVAAYLAEHADHVIIMGGTAAVSEAVEQQIRAIKQAHRPARPMAVTRHAGTDRYHTAALFARWLIGPVLEGRVCFTADTAGLATGTNPADAAASGPLLAHRCAPLLLTEPDQMPPHTRSFLRRTTELIVFGGTKAINNSALRDWTQ